MLFAWGLGTSGQLGNGIALSKSSPVQIGSIQSYLNNPSNVTSITQIGTNSYYDISAGDNYTLAISNTNVLYQWGANDSLPLIPSPTNMGFSASSINAGQENVGFIKKD